MERMEREELEKLKDFKVYVFEGDVYVKAEDYKEIAIENKKLKEYQQRSQSADGEQIERLLGEKIKLEEENKKLKEERDNCLKEVKLCYNDIHSLEGQIFDLEKENEKLKDKFMLKLAEAFLLPPTSNQMAEYKKRNFSKWYDEIKNQMRKEIKEED